MNQSSGSSNIYSASLRVQANTCSPRSLHCSNSESNTDTNTDTNNNNDNNDNNNSNSNVNSNFSGNERFSSIIRTRVSCRTETAVDRQHSAVIVSPHSGLQQGNNGILPMVPITDTDISLTQFEGTSFYNPAPYVSTQQYFVTEAAAVATATSSPTVFQTPNFLPPYCGFTSNLTEFNMLHMCYQPLIEVSYFMMLSNLLSYSSSFLPRSLVLEL